MAGVILDGGKILLARHAKNGKTYWLLPGGGVDFGETLKAALIRELKEEANVDVEVHRLLFTTDSISPNGDRHTVHLAFHANIIAGEPRLGNDERVVELRWVSRDEMNSLTIFPDIKHCLLEVFENALTVGAPYVDTEWKEA